MFECLQFQDEQEGIFKANSVKVNLQCSVNKVAN